jgi:hypothetical protein
MQQVLHHLQGDQSIEIKEFSNMYVTPKRKKISIAFRSRGMRVAQVGIHTGD